MNILNKFDINFFSITLISYLMTYYFDKKTYNENENIFANESFFLNQFIENLFPNILYLNGSDYRSVRIDDIRKIINDLNKSPIKKDKRFIILDDIDSFNINSLNALLKIIEDPGKNNFFILINNKSNKLLNTIKSRSIEIKIMINNKDRLSISTSLLKYFNQELSKIYQSDEVKRRLFQISFHNFGKIK